MGLLSKLNNFQETFSKLDSNFHRGEDLDTSVEEKVAPRSLNSDISYFGVGGKQAIFFIGTATRVSVLPFEHLH